MNNTYTKSFEVFVFPVSHDKNNQKFIKQSCENRFFIILL